MSPWSLIVIAYALTVAGALGLTAWSYAAMRRAEQAADALSQRP